MQRNRPGPAHFKAAFAGGSTQDITARPRSRAATLRPINHPPGWLETILMRPIRVECWSCLRPSWLHRGQKDATPRDWTCLNCQTHQRRDKDGNIESVPEMYDSTLNEDTSERIARSRISRNRARSHGSTSSRSQEDVFCDKCSSNQRVIYQLLSNYIPDEDDENYEAFLENADAYRQQVEERYPLACTDCLDRVQQKLSQQNYRIKSSLLNATLSKSRGDRISPTRKYPDALWLLTGASWIVSHVAWTAVELGVLLHLPNIRPFEALRQRRYSAEHPTLNTIAGTISKLNIAFVWPWASTFGRPFRDLQEHEYRMLLLLALVFASVASLFWDPLQLMQWRSPRARIRTRWYHSWTKRTALPLLVLQFVALYSNHLWQESLVGYSMVAVLHALYLVAFFTGRQALDPIELRFTPSVPSSPPLEASTNENARSDNRSNRPLAVSRQGSFVDRSFSPPALSRTASDPSNRFAASPSPSWADYSGSQSDSQDANQMNWSPKKSASSPPTRLPAVFGTYRDPNQRTNQDDPFLQGMARFGQDPANTYTSHTSTHNNDRNNDNKFRSRAYEPSPLANPSLITNMSLGNISFGEMLGFPSAKFQQPENHFAHRSQPDSGRSEPWAFRKPAESKTNTFGMDRIHRRGQPSRLSGLSRNADVDMEGDGDDDDEDNDNNIRRGAFGQRRRDAGSDSDLFGNSFSAMGQSNQARDSWTVDGREAFAAQTYFPPEPETGLEDNFFGVVKIVDDYLPPKQEPRTIDARNLMLKKRMARRWLVFMLICRVLSLLKPDGQWLDKLLWTSHHVFAIVLLHATAFWVLDESRALQRYLNRKPSKNAEKKTAVAVKSKDPFEPTSLDKICSYILMILLSLRVMSLAWAVASKPEQGVDMNDSCIRGLDLSSGKNIEYCQIPVDDRYSDLDWPIGAVQLAMPWAYDSGYDLRTLASYAGWIHDGAIVALFGVLMMCGAGAPSAKDRSKAPDGRKVKS